MAKASDAIKNAIGAAVFALLGAFMCLNAPSTAIAWVIGILLFTVYLFAFEIVAVDVAAVCIMVLLGLLGIAPTWLGLETPLVDANRLFVGFSSNAVMSIIAVMIIGAGLDKTGIMNRVAGLILRIGGSTETRIIPLVSSAVGFISSFMQNVGAAALFLPVISRISTRTGLPASRLLMPMGFCAILGGTVTMVGSGPLILLNDLILNANKALPPEKQMATFGLFDVTPVGAALVVAGIVYFVVAARWVLPATSGELKEGASTVEFFRQVYGLDYELFEVKVAKGSSLSGRLVQDIERDFGINIVAVRAPSGEPIWPARDTLVETDSVLATMATQIAIDALVEATASIVRDEAENFTDMLSAANAGIGELVIIPGSELIGMTPADLWMRKRFGFAVLAIHRSGQTLRDRSEFRELPLQAGDVLVGHVRWDALMRLEQDRGNFVVVTTNYPREELRTHKVGHAVFFFAVALSLVLFSDLKLAVALFVGALGMVLSGVLRMDEAYQSVSWKTVFLLASLIPLGAAVETTGTAAWIANEILRVLDGWPIWTLQAVIAVLATIFSLVMSNIGATVLLVPLAINIAVAAGGDPAMFALTVGIAVSNSFILPTHQVNALLIGPGGYKVADFLRAGGIMTVLFLVVMLVTLNIVF